MKIMTAMSVVACIVLIALGKLLIFWGLLVGYELMMGLYEGAFTACSFATGSFLMAMTILIGAGLCSVAIDKLVDIFHMKIYRGK